MKKYLSLILVALAIVTACVCLVSCKSDETPLEVVLEELEKVSFKDKTVVYNGKPKNVTVTTRLQYNRLPTGIKVRYEGNGNVEVGEYEVKAIFSKDGVEIPEATKTAKLTIKKAVYDLAESLETFVDSTVSYNGQIQTLKVNEKFLPEGVTVTYDLHDKEPKVAGEYEITAKFTHTNEKNYEPIPDKTVKLTIERKLFDTTGISFNRTFAIFDGAKKTVKISGTLPEGLSVRYEPAGGVISVGKHEFRAIFYTEDPNYEAPAPMVTTLEILNEDFSSGDDLSFKLNDDKTGYVITKYNGKDDVKYLILPETYMDLPVTEVGADVFADQSFEYVYMPDNFTTIGDGAFVGCKNLKELYLSANLTTIGMYAFEEAAIQTITIPENVTEIPSSCFQNCKQLTSVKLGSKVTSIGLTAFKGCSSLDKIFIPKSVVSIAEGNTKIGRSPFVGTADNFMIVLEDIKAGENFSECWTALSTADTTKKALVLYNQTYESFINNHAALRQSDTATALAGKIILGSTPLAGFDPNTFTYTAFANINYGYPIVDVDAASPAALVTIEQATVANGSKATITIVSADGAATQTYTINFKTIGEFTASTEVVNKNNADAAIYYVIDDGYHDTATFAKSMIEKYDYLNLSFAVWTKDLATLNVIEPSEPGGKQTYEMDGDRYVYTITEANKANIDFWADILKGIEGRAEIVSHSHTHAPWGVNDDGGEYTYVDNNNNVRTATMPVGSSSKEYYASKQIIADLFPNLRNLGFVTPGIGVKPGNYTLPDGTVIPGYEAFANQVLKDCINNNVYLAARATFSPTKDYDYSRYIITKDTINNISTRMALPGLAVRPAEAGKEADEIALWTKYIDAAIEARGLAGFCIHEIDSTPKNTKWWISEDMAEQLFAYTQDKNVWIPTYNDAMLYYIEWATAKADAKYDSATNKIAVTLTDEEEENDIFNLALTVKVTVPVMWENVKCGNKALEVHTNADGTKHVFVDVVPDAEAVYLEMVAD